MSDTLTGYLNAVESLTGSLNNGTSVVGSGSGNDKYYVHTQSVAASAWRVNHGLNKYPSVSIVDSGGNQVYGDVKYTDANNLTISFVAAFQGKAYIN